MLCKFIEKKTFYKIAVKTKINKHILKAMYQSVLNKNSEYKIGIKY